MSEYCCFIPRNKNTPIAEAKEIWKKNNGYFIGIGFIFPKDIEQQLEPICSKAKIELYRLPMNGLSFEAYKSSYKLDYLRTKKGDQEVQLSLLMNKNGFLTIDEITEPSSVNDLPIKELIEKITKTKDAIQRLEKAEVVRKTTKTVTHDIPLPYTVQDLLKDLTLEKEGLKTGYESLDTILEIPQAAITLVAGRPSHGKTTIQLNFLVRMVKLYPEMKFYFFSYEETKSQILLKILNLLSQDIIDERNNLANLEGYLRGGHKGRPKIDEASKQLQDFTESGRLIISDIPHYVEDLSSIISRLKSELKNELGAIFIDYIQKIKIKSKFQTRQLELQKISEAILETAKSNQIPILLGAQLGRGSGKKEVLRLDNLREAGDIENDSKLVIGIWNSSKEEEWACQKRKVEIELVLLKNRNGPSNQSVFLEFDKPLSFLNEKPSKEEIR